MITKGTNRDIQGCEGKAAASICHQDTMLSFYKRKGKRVEGSIVMPVSTVSICRSSFSLPEGVSLTKSARAAACGPMLLARPAW